MKLVIDPEMAAFADQIQDLIERIDVLKAHPDPDAEQRLIADVDAMKRDLNAELIARSSVWTVLNARVQDIVH